jgi:hypothetical protein
MAGTGNAADGASFLLYLCAFMGSIAAILFVIDFTRKNRHQIREKFLDMVHRITAGVHHCSTFRFGK